MHCPTHRHVLRYLGLFVSEIEAAQAYDKALIKLRGPSAPMNFSAADYPEVLAEIGEMWLCMSLSLFTASLHLQRCKGFIMAGPASSIA